MKSILMSIQPKWVEKIISGEKTIEVRKTTDKCKDIEEKEINDLAEQFGKEE